MLAERKVYIPTVLGEIASLVYGDHACKRDVVTNYRGKEVSDTLIAPSITREDYEFAAFKALTLNINAGVTPSSLYAAIRKANSEGTRHISVRVPIDDPAALDQLHSLRAQGFYLAAIEVKRERDYVVMQSLGTAPGSPCLPDPGQLHAENARSLARLIRAANLSRLGH
jgi:hypothetical protein